jgi:hypothetical protein
MTDLVAVIAIESGVYAKKGCVVAVKATAVPPGRPDGGACKNSSPFARPFARFCLDETGAIIREFGKGIVK